MTRYSRLKNDTYVDDNSADLFMGQESFPRDGDYIQLYQLDEEGNALEDQRSKDTHLRFENFRRKTRNLVLYLFGVVFLIVLIAVFCTLRRRQPSHESESDDIRILKSPLDSHTRFSNGTHEFKRSTLLLSLSGMHPHYLSSSRTPNLDKLVKRGFAVPYIRPSFPTQTFPNHWTLITGNYPVNHGIVSDTFYDPELNQEFAYNNITTSQDRRFWGGEPIWITAAQHGIKSAVHMWPGSAANWGDQSPNESVPFDANESLNSTTSRIISWLDREEIPQLMLAYVPDVARVTRNTGISGSSIVGECLLVDNFVGDIVNALKARNLTNIINLVIVSDHGMAPLSKDHIVYVDDIVTNYANATRTNGWPLVGLRFKTSEEVKLALKSAKVAKLKDKVMGYTAYGVDEMPSRWRFTTKKIWTPKNKSGFKGKYIHRLDPLYIVPDPTYSLLTHSQVDDMGQFKGSNSYDNDDPMMRGLFVAQGPAFPAGKYRQFDNVDVYSAICRSLGFPESVNSDGDFTVTKLNDKVPLENYPGTKLVDSVFKGSSFDTFYTYHS